MHTYIALLRGINVGGNNKIEMKKLKEEFESLGYKNVVTYINSGNVIFDTKKAKEETIVAEIEKMIERKFKLSIRVVIRDKENMETLCKKIPKDWVNDKDYKTDVMFLWDEFKSKDTLKLIETTPKIDTVKYIDGAIVWHLEKKNYNKSGMSDLIGTEVYKNMTVRNINTVRKLNELLSQ